MAIRNGMQMTHKIRRAVQVGHGRLASAIRRPPKSWHEIPIWQRYGLQGLNIAILIPLGYVIKDLTTPMSNLADYAVKHPSVVLQLSSKDIGFLIIASAVYGGLIWMGWFFYEHFNSCRKSIEDDTFYNS